MATGVTIDDVTTGDGTPVAAPHRISGIATKDAATFHFTPNDDPLVGLRPPFRPGVGVRPGPTKAARAVIAFRITYGGATPYTGVLAGRRGLPCSDSLPCSEALACSEWESPAGTQLSEDVTYLEIASEADGERPVNVWANFEGTWV